VRFAVEGPTPPAKDPWGNTRIGVSATTKINRKDFGLKQFQPGGKPFFTCPGLVTGH
jgi:polyisoprenoid-binding protein YceI